MLSPHYVARSIITITLLFLTTFTLYEWDAKTLVAKSILLPSQHDLSTPISNPSLRVLADIAPDGYRTVYSASTANKQYFLVDFVDHATINPNIIPHPTKNDTWIIVAQRSNTGYRDQ